MKKLFFLVSTLVVVLFVASCNMGNKTNPLWGLWIQKPIFGPKIEIMFNDDNTGFVFVEDTVKYETMWRQDSLLLVNFFEASSTEKKMGNFKLYKVTIDGDVMQLEEKKTGKITKYSRYVEK